MVVLAKQTRGPGRLMSPSQAPPQQPIVLTVLLDQADIDDPTLVITSGIEDGPTSSGPWRLVMENTWHGGGAMKPGTTRTGPVQQLNTTSTYQAFMRGYLDLPRSLSVGVDVTFV